MTVSLYIGPLKTICKKLCLNIENEDKLLFSLYQTHKKEIMVDIIYVTHNPN